MREGEKIKCTVEVLTRNSAATLRACLESLRDFDEILVLDGNSTDGTRTIAEEYGCHTERQTESAEPEARIRDFSEVRNKGLRLARHRWFLFVDSDEYLSREAAAEIRSIVERRNPPYWIWNVPRKYVNGRTVVDCAATYPNFQTRFFNLDHVLEFKKAVHERIEPLPGEQVGKLASPLYIPLPSMEEIANKRAHYVAIEANRMRESTQWGLIVKIFNTLKASLLYFLRLPRVIFCQGTRMPFAYEWSRHQYNLALLSALFKRLCERR